VSSSEGGTRAVLAALAANLGIAVAKLVAFLITGSSSMLAEAIHSAADSGNQVLLLIGGRRAKRAADEEHPFGYGRERFVYAFLVAIVLFSIGGLFALYEGVEKVMHPHKVEEPVVALAVLVVAIGLESFSLRTAVKEAGHTKGDESWYGFVRHTKIPELPVVLLEDVAALIGLVLALVGLLLSVVTGDAVWDGIATTGIGALLVAVAVVVGIEAKGLLVGEAASPADVRTVRASLDGTPGVVRVIHLRTLHLGPEELLVAAKVEIDAGDMAGLARTIDAAEERVRAATPSARVIYLEPDVYRAAAAG